MRDQTRRHGYLLHLLGVKQVAVVVNKMDRVDFGQDRFNEIKTELMVYGIISMLLIYLSAIGIYYFESDVQPEAFGDVFSCLWWAVATLTTVGYGDVYPITTAGRLFTGLILLIGLSVIAIPSGLLASALTAIRAEDAASAEAQKNKQDTETS